VRNTWKHLLHTSHPLPVPPALCKECKGNRRWGGDSDGRPKQRLWNPPSRGILGDKEKKRKEQYSQAFYRAWVFCSMKGLDSNLDFLKAILRLKKTKREAIWIPRK
jgi:hypothetical protein